MRPPPRPLPELSGLWPAGVPEALPKAPPRGERENGLLWNLLGPPVVHVEWEENEQGRAIWPRPGAKLEKAVL